jgi:SagB-type dehydrogenase family enzyme
MLDYLGERRRLSEFARKFSLSSSECRALMRRLVNVHLVTHDRPQATDPWEAWPEAAWLHFMSRDTAFPVDVGKSERAFLARERVVKGPRPTTRRSGPNTGLVLALETSVGTQLRRRRTWREFGNEKVTASQLSTLLHLTFAVQHWARSSGGQRVALKTSPSGGASHPVEAYVAVRRTSGVKDGLYHYDAARRRLTRVGSHRGQATLKRYLPSQPWFWRAPVVVLLVAVYERTVYRYPSPRSYRNIFLEAGHLAQSFCLLATELGLAPFSTHALVDSDVDRDLGLNGIDEGVVYAVGCGPRPKHGWRPGIPIEREPR